MCNFFTSLQCYLFHMYVGVRAGGGIGDEIEDPAGDEYELYRVVFDITFFFFVIVILLAIIQGKNHAGLKKKHFVCISCDLVPKLLICARAAGLIIDAFGELRDQQEQVKEDMEVKYLRMTLVPTVGTTCFNSHH